MNDTLPKLCDRELQQLAGRAAGVKTYRAYGDSILLQNDGNVYAPLDDNDLAFELLVKLDIRLVVGERAGGASDAAGKLYTAFEFTDELSKMDGARRAVVCIAAELGKLL